MLKIANFFKNNKVATFIIFLFFSIIYLVISNFQADNLNASIINPGKINPYLLVTKGSAIIKRINIINIKEKEKKDLIINDKVTTFDESNATIFWPDGSITRLGPKTAITIKEMDVNKDLSNIKIKFNVEQGKTWSNIVKFITKDSYFTETYDFGDYVATVRGTVFEMNMEENYIHAVNHDVNLIDTKKDETYKVSEGLGRNLSNPENTTPKEIFDMNWINENMKFDQEYLIELAKNWQDKVDNVIKNQTIGTRIIGYIKEKLGNNDYIIGNASQLITEGKDSALKNIKNVLPKLSQEQKLDLNNKLNSYYQNIHGLPNSDGIAVYKSNLRDLIIETSPEDIKNKIANDFIKLDIYDYIGLSKDKQSKASGILKENINAYIKQMQDPKELQNLFSSFGQNMLDIIGETFGTFNNSLQDMINGVKNTDFSQFITK